MSHVAGEAMQTVNVSNRKHDPELGRGTGAITNVVLRSGGNRFNGAVYEFIQNSALDARSFFNPTVGHLAYNQFGGRIGGPLKHNKLFFFPDYQRTQDHQAHTHPHTNPPMPFPTDDLTPPPQHQLFDSPP